MSKAYIFFSYLISICTLNLNSLAFANPFAYDPEVNGPVYEVIGKRCSEGIMDGYQGIGLNIALARDFFYGEGDLINQRIDEGGWDPIELPFDVEGTAGSVCDNNGKATTLVITIRRIEWPRKK